MSLAVFVKEEIDGVYSCLSFLNWFKKDIREPFHWLKGDHIPSEYLRIRLAILLRSVFHNGYTGMMTWAVLVEVGKDRCRQSR